MYVLTAMLWCSYKSNELIICSHGTLVRCGKLAIIVSYYYHFHSGMDKNGTVLNFTLTLCAFMIVHNSNSCDQHPHRYITAHTMYCVCCSYIKFCETTNRQCFYMKDVIAITDTMHLMPQNMTSILHNHIMKWVLILIKLCGLYMQYTPSLVYYCLILFGLC